MFVEQLGDLGKLQGLEVEGLQFAIECLEMARWADVVVADYNYYFEVLPIPVGAWAIRQRPVLTAL